MRKCLTLMSLIVLALSSQAVAAGEKSRFFEFDYKVVFQKLDQIPADAEKLDVWVPLLPDTEHQRVEEVTITPNNLANITEDSTYDNKFIYFTVDTPVDPEFEINVHYKVRRYEFSNKPDSTFQPANSGTQIEGMDRYLKANRLVVINPEIQDIAKNVTDGKGSTLDKARAIYDYVFENVSYDKTVPGYGQGDTARVCLLKAGNCTDFHSLFISLSRASDIPAKFVIGIPIAKEKQGELAHYHCWAEFYEKNHGWIPVDISEAWKDKAKKEYHFGAVDESRLEFSHGRDIVLTPPQKADPLNYFVYPHAEIDGELFKNLGVVFKYQDIEDDILTKQMKNNRKQREL